MMTTMLINEDDGGVDGNDEINDVDSTLYIVDSTDGTMVMMINDRVDVENSDNSG